MPSMDWRIRFSSGLTALLVSGCFTYPPYGYGPTGPAGPPGIYTTPPPGGAMPQGPVLGTPSTFSPGGPSGGQWQQSQDAFPSGSGGSTPSNGSTYESPGRVPEYNDPGYDGGDHLDLNEGSDSPFGYNGNGASATGVTQVSAAMPQQPTQALLPTNTPELQPVPQPAAVEDPSTEAQRRLNPFDHDAEDFSWLRGVVDYDDQDGTWNIIYDDNPQETDRFGGSMTLVADERFSALENNDVILVHGHIDGQERDRLGKPRYRVDKLEKLIPKSR